MDLNFSNVFSHLEQATQDIAFRPVMHDINKLMRRDNVRNALRHKLGDRGYKAIVSWQQALAQNRNSPQAKGFPDALANWIRTRTVAAGLLFRPGTILQNNANFTLYGNAADGFTEKDAISAYFKHGVSDYIPNAFGERGKELREFVFARSSMMRDKMDAPDFTLRELQGMVKDGNVLSRNFTGAIQDAGIKIELTQAQALKLGTDILARADQLTDIPMWLGAYEKAISKGVSERDAVHFADTVIERSTGSGRLLDTSGLQRGTPGERLLTMYTGFFNTTFNRWVREGNIFMTRGDVGRLFWFTLNRYVMFGVLSALLSGKWPEEDKYGEWFINEVALWPLSMVPAMGAGIKIGLQKALGLQAFGYSISPVESQVNAVIRAAAGRLDGESAGGGNAEATAAAAAFILKYPDQINDWFFNAWDILYNGMEPQAGDILRRRPLRER